LRRPRGRRRPCMSSEVPGRSPADCRNRAGADIP
jgi:hypothetical protein